MFDFSFTLNFVEKLFIFFWKSVLCSKPNFIFSKLLSLIFSLFFVDTAWRTWTHIVQNTQNNFEITHVTYEIKRFWIDAIRTLDFKKKKNTYTVFFYVDAEPGLFEHYTCFQGRSETSPFAGERGISSNFADHMKITRKKVCMFLCASTIRPQYKFRC